MKNSIILLISFLTLTFRCVSQNTNALNNGYQLKKSDRYTLVHSDSIKTFISAEYPGKEVALTAYLDSTLKKFTLSEYKKYNKILYVRITITENGKVEKVDILKNIKDCTYCNDVTIKVIQNMPDWIPAYGIYKNHTKRKEKDQALIPLNF